MTNIKDKINKILEKETVNESIVSAVWDDMSKAKDFVGDITVFIDYKDIDTDLLNDGKFKVMVMIKNRDDIEKVIQAAKKSKGKNITKR